MTTTYELYTNENGTPKAVEGKAPAIIERVETLETNVETLEGTLDNGVVTSVNGNSGDITPEQTGCLPLSGGTMTGAIRFNDGNSIYQTKDSDGVNVYGGSDTWRGAGLQLFGMSSTGNEGCFNIYTNNGSTSSSLRGQPDGILTWGGKEVERVVHTGANCHRYESGIQICWGISTLSSGGTDVTFALPFAMAPSVTITETGAGSWHNAPQIHNTDTTRFNGSHDAGWTCHWIAIGYWK